MHNYWVALMAIMAAIASIDIIMQHIHLNVEAWCLFNKMWYQNTFKIYYQNTTLFTLKVQCFLLQCILTQCNFKTNKRHEKGQKQSHRTEIIITWKRTESGQTLMVCLASLFLSRGFEV